MTTAIPEPVFEVDAYAHCEGVNFEYVAGLTPGQASRLNKLRRRQGLGVASCTHDLARGALLSDLTDGSDGPYTGNPLFTAPLVAGVGGWLSAQVAAARGSGRA